MSIGISQQGTSLEGLQDLWRILDGYGQLFVFNEGLPASSFHPKTFLFRNPTHARVVAGSNNLTEGGLYRNHELATVSDLDLVNSDDALVLAEVEAALDHWQTASRACLLVDLPLLQSLHDQGDVPSELATRVARRQASSALRARRSASSSPTVTFGPIGAPTAVPQPGRFPTGLPAAPVVPQAPPPPTPPTPGTTPRTSPPSTTSTGSTTPPSAGPPPYSVLFMEVRPHHNGEVFLSYRAIHDDPTFFGHPFTGWSAPTSTPAPYPAATPDPLVEIIVHDASGAVTHHKPVHGLNIVDYERKREIRITLPDRLQDHIPAMSLLVMTRDPSPVLDYRLEFFASGAPQIATYVPRLVNALPTGGSGVPRRYGWI
jgi:hypothetical protein